MPGSHTQVSAIQAADSRASFRGSGMRDDAASKMPEAELKVVAAPRRQSLMPESWSGHKCPVCMELYFNDDEGMRVPRILTACGHTACCRCITILYLHC